MTFHETHPIHEPWRDLPAGFADYLELESRLSAPARNQTLDHATFALNAPPSHIIDLGSGTGADAIAMAQRFPSSHVHALDVSEELLNRLAAASTAAGVTNQIESRLVDLDDDWSQEIPPDVDLAWAALSLHHVADPATLLRRVFTSLRPGGMFILTELAGEVRFAPIDLGTRRPGLQERLMRTLPHGTHASTDWSGPLTEAGFTSVERHEHEFVVRADTADGARYLSLQLQAQRHRLSHDMSDDDLTGLDEVIAALENGTSEVSFSSGRAVWIAIRQRADSLDGATPRQPSPRW